MEIERKIHIKSIKVAPQTNLINQNVLSHEKEEKKLHVNRNLDEQKIINQVC